MNKLILNSFNEPIDVAFEGTPKKVEIMSLLYKKKTIDLSKAKMAPEIIPYDVVWIRIFDDKGIGYNVLAQSVLIIKNENGLLIQINSTYEVVTVYNIVEQLRALSYKSDNNLDFEKSSVYADYIKYVKDEISILQRRRDLFVKNSSTNSDIVELNEWVNKRDQIIYDLTKVEIMKKLAEDNKAEIEEVLNEKRLGFV